MAAQDEHRPGSRRPGCRGSILEYLLAHVGEVVKSSDLQAVCQGAVQYSRRLRELREAGWQISSHRDRTDLALDEYVLESVLQGAGVSPEAISGRLRAEVLARDGGVCQFCGAVAGEPHPIDPTRRTVLQVGHITDRSMGGSSTDVNNLRALCMICNLSASNILPEPPEYAKLLAHVRKAKIADQRALYAWLGSKFEPHADASSVSPTVRDGPADA